MPLTQHYHTRDPIENLRVHVTLRKIANAAGGDAETTQTAEGVGRTWDYCFRWQEKKLSTAQQQQQRNLNAKDKQKSKKNETGADTEDATEDSDLPSTSNASSSSVLCSYIGADNYAPKEELTRDVVSSDTNSITPTTHLVDARHRRLPPAQHALVTPRERNAERAWVRHHREESFRCMHIVASLGTSAATAVNRYGGGRTEVLDEILCSIRFHAESGLLSVTPGFSVALLESEKEDPEALTKGPKLSTYHVSIGGAQYEYTLDNVNDLLPLVSTTDQQLLRELQIQEERQDVARVAQLRLSGRGGGPHNEQQQLYYDAMKLSGVLKRRLVLVEVVEARDLGCGVIGSSVPVFVELSLHFPSGNMQQRSGNGSTLTMFNFHTKFDLELCKRTSKASHAVMDGSEQLEQVGNDGDEGSQMTVSPVLSLAIFSRDSWGRKRTEGFGGLTIPPSPGHYDRFVPIAKPISSVREQMEELFLGVDESEDAIVSGSQLSAESTTLHNVNSRLGVQVQSTGASIRVRFNVVDQSPPQPPRASSHPLNQKRFGAGTGAVLPHPLPGPLRVVKRSVNEILQSVRLEKRLSQTGTDPSSQSSPTSSTTLSGVSSTANAALARLNAAKASPDNTTS